MTSWLSDLTEKVSMSIPDDVKNMLFYASDSIINCIFCIDVGFGGISLGVTFTLGIGVGFGSIAEGFMTQ